MVENIKDIYSDLSEVSINTEKNLAIWGKKGEYLDLFAMAINNRVQIQYFVDIIGNCEGLNFFNEKIVTKSELLERKDIFVIVGKDSYDENAEWIHKNLWERYCVIAMGEIKESIRDGSNIYIYGAGGSGKKTLEVLRKKNIKVVGFVDSNNNKVGKTWCNYPIYSKELLGGEDIVIISTMYYAEICEELSKDLPEKNIYIDYRNSRPGNVPVGYEDMKSIWIKYKHYPLMMLEKIGYLWVAFRDDYKDKEIIIYGANEIAEQLILILRYFGKSVSRVIEEEDVYELAYEQLSNKMIILAKVNEKETQRNRMITMDSGKLLEEMDVHYFDQWRSGLFLAGMSRPCKRDNLLGGVWYDKHIESDRLGFYIHGDVKSKKKIVILGGSTSDAIIYGTLVKSWPEYLKDKCKDAVIYNGAVAGYSSVQECLKMLRDVVHLKPDLVISYSGVNDNGQIIDEKQPFIRKGNSEPDVWYGLESSFERADYWMLMQRYMKALAEVNGSDFIAILQPYITLRKKEDMPREEKLISMFFPIMESYISFISKVRDKMSEYDWMYDLTSVFDDVNENVFKDGCHLTEYGNEIIADKIYDIINDYYEKRGRVECIY